MSGFLGFESFLVPLGAGVEDVKATIGNALTAKNYQVVGKTVAYQSVISGNWATPAPAFDGFDQNPTGLGTIPCQIGVQLQVAAAVTKYTIFGRDDGNKYGQVFPRSWTLEYSDNGTTWTVADTRTNEPGTRQRQEARTYVVSGSPGAHLYWRLNITAVQSTQTQTQIAEIRFYIGANEWVSQRASLYMLPPATETVGDGNTRELLLIGFTGTTITFQPAIEVLTAYPQTIAFYNKTGGAVAAGIYLPDSTPEFGLTATTSNGSTTLTVTASSGTLAVGQPIYGPGIPMGAFIQSMGTSTGGAGTVILSEGATASFTAAPYTAKTTVLISGAVGSAGATSQDNLRALYAALRTSTDPAATAWTWSYSKPAPQNGYDAFDWIVGVANMAAMDVTVPFNANVNPANPTPISANATIGQYCSPRILGLNDSPTGVNTNGAALTTDLINGFIYYLQICSRGIALATKTNANFYGPIHACWADHTKAMAILPATTHPRAVSPIELFVGFDGAQSAGGSTAFTARMIGLGPTMNRQPTMTIDASQYTQGVPGSGFVIRGQFGDIGNVYSFSGPGWYAVTELYSSGIFIVGTESTSDDFQIHRMVMNGHDEQSVSVLNYSSPPSTPGIIPQADIQDWYKFRGTATNEALALAADTVVSVTLNQAMDSTTAYNTLDFVDASTLPSSGYVVIENEVVQYTGKSGNTITGVTRAKYGTQMQQHWSGDKAYLGLWFTIINGGALFCGYQKPA